MLARGEGAAGHAIDEDFETRFAMGLAQPHMVGGAFVAERGRDRRVNREPRRIAERQAQLRKGRRPFVATVRHGL